MLLVYLQDTELKVSYRHRDSISEIEVADSFDRGRWKQIRLIKDNSLLTVVVDREKSASMQVPKKLHLNRQIWIGGYDREVAAKTVR